MSLLEAFLLALVQGVTEFLPISSSAHLILLPYLLGWQEHDVTFEIVTNGGTLLAAVFYFRQDLLGALRQLLPGQKASASSSFLLRALVLGTVPVVIAGLLFYDFFSGPARSPVVIAWASILFGLLLYWADRRGRRQRELGSLGVRDSLWIGFAQAVALIPGTSRSGITMTAALWRGFSREEGARFSFMLAIPVGAMALAKNLLDTLSGSLPEQDWGVLAFAFVVAGVSAYLAIGWLLAWLGRQTMTLFVLYRIILGLLILVVVGIR
jgi:undecaprenyl-diphosphatase